MKTLQEYEKSLDQLKSESQAKDKELERLKK